MVGEAGSEGSLATRRLPRRRRKMAASSADTLCRFPAESTITVGFERWALPAVTR